MDHESPCTSKEINFTRIYTIYFICHSPLHSVPGEGKLGEQLMKHIDHLNQTTCLVYFQNKKLRFPFKIYTHIMHRPHKYALAYMHVPNKYLCACISKRNSFTLRWWKQKRIQKREKHLSPSNFLSLFQLPLTFHGLSDCNPFVFVFFHFSLVFNPSKDWFGLSHHLATLKPTPLGVSLQCKQNNFFNKTAQQNSSKPRTKFWRICVFFFFLRERERERDPGCCIKLVPGIAKLCIYSPTQARSDRK